MQLVAITLVVIFSIIGVSKLDSWVLAVTMIPMLLISSYSTSTLLNAVLIPKKHSVIGTLTVNYTDPDKELFSLSLDADPYDFADQDVVVLKVKNVSSNKHLP